METIGDEVLLLIIGKLDWPSLPTAKLVCKRWLAVASEPLAVKLICAYIEY